MWSIVITIHIVWIVHVHMCAFEAYIFACVCVCLCTGCVVIEFAPNDFRFFLSTLVFFLLFVSARFSLFFLCRVVVYFGEMNWNPIHIWWVFKGIRTFFSISIVYRKIAAEALMMRATTMATAAVVAQHNVLWYVIFSLSPASIHFCSFVKYANGNSLAVCVDAISTSIHIHTHHTHIHRKIAHNLTHFTVGK